MFKIGDDFVGSPSFHVHWSKTDSVDRSGTFCKWRIDYTVFNGSTQEVSGGSFVETSDLEYLDDGTSTRYVYRSENLPLTGFVAGYYVAMKITSITPTGSALPDPGMVSVDLIYEATINRGT